MAYSDYPFPDHFPNYLHNSKIMEYLRMYVKHFHLLKHIRFLVSGTENTQHTRKSLVRAQSQAKAVSFTYISMEVSFRRKYGRLTEMPNCTPGVGSLLATLRTVVWKNWANLTLKMPCSGDQLYLSTLMKAQMRVPAVNFIHWGQEFLRASGKSGHESFFSFPVEGVQCEEALWFLFHGTVGCCGAGWRKTGILCLWWDYGV